MGWGGWWWRQLLVLSAKNKARLVEEPVELLGCSVLFLLKCFCLFKWKTLEKCMCFTERIPLGGNGRHQRRKNV